MRRRGKSRLFCFLRQIINMDKDKIKKDASVRYVLLVVICESLYSPSNLAISILKSCEIT